MSILEANGSIACAECGKKAYDENNQLKTENAKLKELVKDMWSDIPKTESCGWDMSANHCVGYDKCKGECSYWYRMHKLGIEVDDEDAIFL